MADEIAKDFANPNQNLYESQPEINGHATPSSPATSPVTKPKPKPKPSPRRISTRKRPAPESEPGPETLSLPTDNEEQDEDAQGDTDHGEHEEALESASTAGRHSRRKGVKRVRLSEPGSISAPARSTRSRKDASPSGPSISTSGVEKRMTRASANASANMNGSERKTTRKSRRRVEEESDKDAEGESEQSEEEKGEEEEGRKQTRQFTGPKALAAALTQANTESRTPRLRGRQPNATTSTTSSSRPRGIASATATKSKTQSQSAVISRTRSSGGMGAPSSPMAQRPKRTIKPTAKAALLSPAKTSVSTPSRPARAQLLAQQRQRRVQAQTRIQAMKRRPVSAADGNGSAGRSETPKEVFDGVLLKRRRINGGSGGYLVPGHGEGGLEVHLDEFVANGLEREHAYVNVNGDEMDRDPVLDRDDMSSLGGSNKGKSSQLLVPSSFQLTDMIVLENDFSFRNDVSESTEGPEGTLASTTFSRTCDTEASNRSSPNWRRRCRRRT